MKQQAFNPIVCIVVIEFSGQQIIEGQLWQQMALSSSITDMRP